MARNEANPWAVRHSRRRQVDRRNKALGELRLQVSGGAQKEARMVGRTAGQKREGGQWKVARGVGSVGVCVWVWEGPREVAAEAGDDDGVYMSQGRQAGHPM